MNRPIVISLFLLCAAIFCVGQTIDAHTNAELHAQNWEVRAIALRKLRGIHTPEARHALIDLLDLENRNIDSAYREGIGAEYQYGEDYTGGYVTDLQQVVTDNYKQYKDPEALHVLIETSYNPGSEFAYWLAEQGPQIVPELLRMAGPGNSFPERDSGLAVLAHFVRYCREHNQPIPSTMSLQIHSAFVRAARDKDGGIRMDAVDALGEAGDARDLPMLEKIASADPAKLPPPMKPIYTVRKEAKKAISQIQKRLANNE